MSGDVKISYPVRVRPGVLDLSAALRPDLERLIGAVATGLLQRYADYSESERIRDTGHFIDTMAVHQTDDPLQRIVKSDARYSGIIEDGWIRRARGQRSYPARRPAAFTVRANGVKAIIEEAVGSIFGRRPETLYHGTHRANLPSIMAHGLDPSRMTPDYLSEEGGQHYVFFDRGGGFAEEWVEMNEFPDPVILAVDLPEDLYNQLVFDQGEFIRSPILISPQFIRVMGED